jgi:hypothetical protein
MNGDKESDMWLSNKEEEIDEWNYNRSHINMTWIIMYAWWSGRISILNWQDSRSRLTDKFNYLCWSFYQNWKLEN